MKDVSRMFESGLQLVTDLFLSHIQIIDIMEAQKVPTFEDTTFGENKQFFTAGKGGVPTYTQL